MTISCVCSDELEYGKFFTRPVPGDSKCISCHCDLPKGTEATDVTLFQDIGAWIEEHEGKIDPVRIGFMFYAWNNWKMPEFLDPDDFRHEERIRVGHEIYCEKCYDLFDSLHEAGFCPDGENLLADWREYVAEREALRGAA